MSTRKLQETHLPTAGSSPMRPAMAWVITGMLVVLTVINWADKTLIAITAQPLQDELGLTPTQIGFIGSAFFFLFGITGLVVGFVVDRMRIRIKWVLLTIALLWSVAQVPVLVSSTLTALLVSRITLGAAEGPAGAMTSVGAFQWFPKEKRALPAAWLASGASIAKIAVAPVLTLIVAAWGWRAAFITMALAGVVWCVAWLLISREGPYAAANLKSTDGDVDGEVDDRRVPFRRIALTPTFLGATIGLFTLYAVVAVVLTWLPSYFEVALGFSRVQSGFMFGLPSIAGIVMLILVSWYTDRRLVRGATSRVMRGFVAAGALAAGGILLAVTPYVGHRIMAVAVVVIGYGIVSVSYPLMSATVSQLAPARQQASTLAVFNAVFTTGGLVGPALTGILIGAASTPAAGYALAFQVLGLSAVVGGLIIALTVHPERDRAKLAGPIHA